MLSNQHTNILKDNSSISETHHASGLKIPAGEGGPASVESRGAPQARSIPAGRSGGCFGFRRGGKVAMCLDDVEERKGL